jgi:hypothetical protein
LSPVRAFFRGGDQRPGGGLKRYPVEAIYEEAAFIAYHFHWDHQTVLGLEHPERRRWVEEISRINRRISEETGE